MLTRGLLTWVILTVELRQASSMHGLLMKSVQVASLDLLRDGTSAMLALDVARGFDEPVFALLSLRWLGGKQLLNELGPGGPLGNLAVWSLILTVSWRKVAFAFTWFSKPLLNCGCREALSDTSAAMSTLVATPMLGPAAAFLSGWFSALVYQALLVLFGVGGL